MFFLLKVKEITKFDKIKSPFFIFLKKMMPTEAVSGFSGAYYDELSEIKQKDGRLYFPKHYHEDYFVDFFAEQNIVVDEPKKSEIVSVSCDDITYKMLKRLRREAYSAVVWYDSMEPFTYKSDFFPILNNNLEEVLKNCVKYPKFLKLDTFSAKDTDHSCVFYSAEDAINTFQQSERIRGALKFNPITRDHHSLMSREIDPYINEAHEMRCFVYRCELTAVSCANVLSEKDKQRVENFVEEVINELPYQNATIDVILYHSPDLSPKVIELNSFGPDASASAGLFNWKEDYFALHDASTVTWRHKNKFEF